VSELAVREDTRQFLDGSQQIEAADQLGAITEFWGGLGFQVPDLSTAQLDSLRAAVEEHPDHRVVPAPLLGIDGRYAMVAGLGEIPGAPEDVSARLWTPLDSEVGFDGYKHLIRHPNRTADVPDPVSYPSGPTIGSSIEYIHAGMRYRTPDDECVNRRKFSRALRKSGHGVEGDGRTTWTFPVMDVSLELDGPRVPRADILRSIEPTLTAEALLTLKMLHRLAGTPVAEDAVDERSIEPKLPDLVIWGLRVPRLPETSASTRSLPRQGVENVVDVANEGMYTLWRHNQLVTEMVSGVSMEQDGPISLAYYKKGASSPRPAESGLAAAAAQ